MALDVNPRLRGPAAACAAIATATVAGCALSRAAADIRVPDHGTVSARPSATPAPPPTVPPGMRQLSVAGRTYLLSIPKNVRRPAPLIVALGGIGWNAPMEVANFRINATANAAHAIVAYPDPVKGVWDAGGCCNGAQADDVGFLTKMRSQIAHKVPLDPHRQWILGFSNGGMLAYYAACANGNWTGIVVLGASLTTRCAPTHPFIITNVNGENDRIAPWNGGWSDYTKTVMPAVWEIDQQIASLFGCGPVTQTRSNDNDVFTYTGCHDGVYVRDIRVPRLWHHWPLHEKDGYDIGPVLVRLALG
jgi:polyhydroxybutyrate depolymerase